jgi:TPR repeat protein
VTPAQQLRAITLGSGGVAGALIGLLIYVFWPQPAKLAAALHASVAQPVFAEPSKPALAAVVIAAVPAHAAAPAAEGPQSSAVVATASPPISAAAPGQAPTALEALPNATINPVPKASDHARDLFGEGLTMLVQGEIAPARLMLEQAAAAGEPRALLALGDSYDPAVLTRLGALGMKGDSGKAKDYYSKAVEGGVAEASQRLAQLPK